MYYIGCAFYTGHVMLSCKICYVSGIAVYNIFQCQIVQSPFHAASCVQITVLIKLLCWRSLTKRFNARVP